MKKTMIAGNLHLNPSLILRVNFKVPNQSGQSDAEYDYSLVRYPVLKKLVLSQCSKKDRTNAYRAIPPELATELHNNGIVLLNTLADKPEAINLNENISISITVFSRHLNAPSRRMVYDLNAHIEASIWLFSALQDQDVSNDLSQLSTQAIDTLLETGAVVEDLPPASIMYPLPQASDHWVAELETAEQIFIQAAGDPVPDKVLKLLGRQIPELSSSNIIWSCDAGTRLVHACTVPESNLAALITHSKQRSAIETVKQRKQEWKQKISVAKLTYRRNAYATLVGVIAPAQQRSLQTHVRSLITPGYFGPVGDTQVDRRMSMHNEPVTSSLHHRLAKLVSIIVGEKVLATYCFLGCYLAGSVLRKHVDRPQCQYNLSLVIDMYDETNKDENETVDPWPIYLELKNKTTPVNMAIGDGLLYKGTDIKHWRDELPKGKRVIACFYHFVNEDFDGAIS